MYGKGWTRIGVGLGLRVYMALWNPAREIWEGIKRRWYGTAIMAYWLGRIVQTALCSRHFHNGIDESKGLDQGVNFNRTFQPGIQTWEWHQNHTPIFHPSIFHFLC